MYKRVALILAVAFLMAVEVQAARRGGRGGCANGQCGIQTSYYQPATKVAADSSNAAAAAVVQASATQPTADAVSTTTVESYQVASQPARRGVFRRWSSR